MLSFTEKEIALVQKLNTPAKVQDYLNSLDFNFEKKGPRLKSPLFTMREGNAHCLEGAMLGAYILSEHGHKPLLLHLKTTKEDFDHVIAPFKVDGLWGALSKTNHSVLRYRDPIYKTVRELAISYFHEYFLNDGTKTLRSYSEPLNLNSFEKNWEVMEGDLWGIDQELDKIKHFTILDKNGIKNLRKAESIEIEASNIVSPKG
jgi:hypothetical protein